MALTLTEGLIRNRVNLTHENLEDIKSLSLPGTFHEKIISIGSSLNKFTRLKTLDFSRNALESLKGLEHLELLERLNLYYNNVSSLDELARLRHNQNLKDLDLRLNPVTRNEPDYRLYLIHMLPNLQKLDDRGVRDRERQAALTHFSSSQAAEMTPAPKPQKLPNKSPLPRTEMMAKLMKGPSVLVDDDVAIIDIMNRNDGDFGKPRPLTGSATKENKAEDYSLEGLKKLDEPRLPKYQSETRDGSQLKKTSVVTYKAQERPEEAGDPQMALYKERYPNIMANPSDNLKRIGLDPVYDSNLRYSDETEANTKYRGHGFFTPHPDGPQEFHGDRGDYGKGQRHGVSRDDSHLGLRPLHKRTNSVPNVHDLSNSSNSFPMPARRDESKDQEKVLLNALLNLVDRYWNGSKSLHKHHKFIEQALKCVLDYSSSQRKAADVEAVKIKMYQLENENETLRSKQVAAEKVPQTAAHETELKHALKRAREDVERLHEELKQYVSENVALRKRLEGHSTTLGHSKINNAGAAAESTTNNSGVLDELQRQNQGMSHELELMRSRMKQYSQLQEVTSMLQESHKSLVETNEHLLAEMREMKHKHQDEIRHMQWSYQQLKSSMVLPDTSYSSFGININNNTTSNNCNQDIKLSNQYGENEGDYTVNDKPSVQMY